MDIIKSYSKKHRLQKQDHATIWKKKLPNEKNPLTKNVLYYAIISCDDEKYKPKLYKGIIETTFKKRYANHKNSLSVEKTRTTQSYVQNTGS